MTFAYVNHGRWVADCGRRPCPEAHRVKPGDGFECRNCGWFGPVEFPDDQKDIELVLAKRPVPESRNWWPGELVADLIVENTRHGVS